MVKTYLDIKELCELTKYKPQSIYNLIHRGIFVKGIHYLKPSKRKILFRWSEIQKWLGEGVVFELKNEGDTSQKEETQSKKVNRINI